LNNIDYMLALSNDKPLAITVPAFMAINSSERTNLPAKFT